MTITKKLLDKYPRSLLKPDISDTFQCPSSDNLVLRVSCSDNVLRNTEPLHLIPDGNLKPMGAPVSRCVARGYNESRRFLGLFQALFIRYSFETANY